MKFSTLEEGFKPLTTFKEIELGVDFFENNKNKFQKATNFRIVFNDSDNILFEDFTGMPCHAKMQAAYSRKNMKIENRSLIATDNGSYRCYDSEEQRKEVHGKYLSWLTHESCFAPFFIPMGDTFHYENGFLISSDIPTSVVQNILLACRFFVECSDKGFELFNYLYDLYGGDVAFHLVSGSNLSLWGKLPKCHYAPHLSQSGDDIVITKRLWHTITPLFNTLSTFSNYLNRNAPKLVNKTATHYRNHASIYGGSTLWGAVNVVQNGGFLSEFVRKENLETEIKKARKEPIGVVKNPFITTFNIPDNQRPNDYLFRWSEVRDIILPALKDKGYFNVC